MSKKLQELEKEDVITINNMFFNGEEYVVSDIEVQDLGISVVVVVGLYGRGDFDKQHTIQWATHSDVAKFSTVDSEEKQFSISQLEVSQ